MARRGSRNIENCVHRAIHRVQKMLIAGDAPRSSLPAQPSAPSYARSGLFLLLVPRSPHRPPSTSCTSKNTSYRRKRYAEDDPDVLRCTEARRDTTQHSGLWQSV